MSSDLQTPALAKASKAVLEERYRVLPYYYTLFWEAHNGQRPYLLHSLIFDWPTDEKVQDITDQFTVGGNLMVAPVFKAGATSRSVYFPASEWYDWRTGAHVSSGGESKDFESHLGM